MNRKALANSSRPEDWRLALKILFSRQVENKRPDWRWCLEELIMSGPQRIEDHDDTTIDLDKLPTHNWELWKMIVDAGAMPHLRKALLSEMQKPLRVFDGSDYRPATSEEIVSIDPDNLWNGCLTQAYAQKLLDFLSSAPKGWGF